MQVGTIDGERCDISEHAANNTVLATGRSGSGKSVRMQQIELECAREGKTVIALDTSSAHHPEFIFSDISDDYGKYVKRIDVAADGLNMSLFHDGNAGVSLNVLGAYYGLGQRQMAILRGAVSAVENSPPDGDDFYHLQNVLQMSGGEELAERMCPLLNCKIERRNNAGIQTGMINVIDVSLFDLEVQEPLAELFLAQCWSRLQRNKGSAGDILFSLDEIQNLSVNRKNSTLHRMLREGRKFHASFLLATQTLGIFRPEAVAMLNQAATRLYFSPPVNEVGRIAREIDSDRTDVWRRKLASLKVGQCIAVGDFVVNGFEISRPLLLN
nr:hypothetical protein [uncultured Acetatifactor sp.]